MLRARASGYELPFDVDELTAVDGRELLRGQPDARRHRPDAVDRRPSRRRPRRAARRAPRRRARRRRRPAGAARHGARLDRHRPRAPRAGGRERGGRPPAVRVARPAARAQPRRERPVPPLRRRRPAPPLPELRDADLLRARPLDGRAARPRPPGARRARATSGPADRAPARGRRLPVALRRRARHGRRALRDLLGAPGRDGADGVHRALGGHRRHALPRRRGPRAALDRRAQRARRRHGRPRERTSSCARSAAAAAPTGCGSPPRPARRSPGSRRRGSTARITELNPTDRPYHFGWVLEAWCGREDVLRDADAA